MELWFLDFLIQKSKVVFMLILGWVRGKVRFTPQG